MPKVRFGSRKDRFILAMLGSPPFPAPEERSMDEGLRPNDLETYWMPFTANRQFKAQPRLMAGAEGMYYRSLDGRKILDGTAGLWCVNAGHARPEIADALRKQVLTLDYAPAFQ